MGSSIMHYIAASWFSVARLGSRIDAQESAKRERRILEKLSGPRYPTSGSSPTSYGRKFRVAMRKTPYRHGGTPRA